MPDSSPSERPSLLRRVSLAFSVLSNADLAARVLALGGEPARTEPAPTTSAEAPPMRQPTGESALQLLALLQREARLVDFCEEDLAGHADADIGAAARVVHEGCRKVLREHFTIEPVRDEAEGARVTLNAGFDAGSVRLTGNVVGTPPFSGELSHRGWRASDVRLPKLAQGHDAALLAPAEVEL